MKKLLVFVLVLGCSSEPTIPDQNNTSSSSSGAGGSGEVDAGMNCTPRRWTWGVNETERYCEICTCPGTDCKHQLIGGEIVAGTCGDDLKCSTKCTDENWIEPDAGP